PGIFSDPNDFTLALSLSVLVSLYAIGSLRGLTRLLWLAPLLVSVYAIVLTKSRGGLLGVAAGVIVLLTTRYGWRKSLPPVLVAPAGLLLVGGAQTRFNISDPDDTGLGRLQLWSKGLVLFWESPLFGIGEGRYVVEEGFVAHNSFIHAYAELGFFG